MCSGNFISDLFFNVSLASLLNSKILGQASPIYALQLYMLLMIKENDGSKCKYVTCYNRPRIRLALGWRWSVLRLSRDGRKMDNLELVYPNEQRSCLGQQGRVHAYAVSRTIAQS